MSLTLSQVAGLQTTTYSNVAGIAILMFDYAITFEDEVRWVWGRRWDVTRCVFTVSRYLPFVGMGMTAYAALHSPSQPCGPNYEENAFHIIGIIAAEVLLVLRTYAFWQCDKRVLYGLTVYSILSIAGAVTINLMPGLLPAGVIIQGCYLVASRDSTLVYLFLLVFEIVILVLMSWKRFGSYRETGTSIVRVIYRDGLFYMVCIMLVTFANIIIDGLAPPQFSDLLDIPQITLHSVLASRILFSLRKNAERVQGVATNTESIVALSEFDCRMPVSRLTTEPNSQARSSVLDIHDGSDVEVARFKPPTVLNV